MFKISEYKLCIWIVGFKILDQPFSTKITSGIFWFGNNFYNEIENVLKPIYLIHI